VAASNYLGMYQLGDTIPLAGRTELAAWTPAPAILRVIHDGKVIAQQAGERIAVPLNERGAYRVEAWLELDGEYRPWIYSNPVHAEPLDLRSVQLPSNELAPEVEVVRNNRGDVFGRDPAVWREASPYFHVRRDFPPFTIAYCQWDYLTLPQQAQRFVAALAKAGARAEVVFIPGEGHISEILRITQPANVIACLFTQALRGMDNQ